MTWHIGNILTTLCVVVLTTPLWFPIVGTLTLLIVPTIITALVVICIRFLWLSLEASICLMLSKVRKMPSTLHQWLFGSSEAEWQIEQDEKWDTPKYTDNHGNDYFFDEFGQPRSTRSLSRI
ncbi:hypothetical protein BDF19DRAFT_420172 [Syncephalis fuscata]|nr:hypothetical protein BDF19DRAFT_420172 [Syncephalis fuscata]